MIIELLQIIQSNVGVIAVVIAAISLGVAIWVAKFSPQALQSKIAKKKYLQEKRKEHNKRLDQEIFKPLSMYLFLRRDGKSMSGMDSLKLNFIQVNENIFKMGISHLEIDFPGFYRDFLKFREDVEKFNSLIPDFYEKPDIFIRAEFSKIFELSENYIFEQDFYILGVKQVKDIILTLILRKLDEISSYDKCLIQDVCQTALIADIEKHAHTSLGGKTPFEIFEISVTNFHFDLFTLAKSDEVRSQLLEFRKMNKEKQQLIIEHICGIVSNEDFFKIYRPVFDIRKQLLEKEKKISNQIKQISKLIYNEEYETIAECCTDKKFL